MVKVDFEIKLPPLMPNLLGPGKVGHALRPRPWATPLGLALMPQEKIVLNIDRVIITGFFR